MNEIRKAIRSRYQADLGMIQQLQMAARVAQALSFNWLPAGPSLARGYFSPDLTPSPRPANPRRDKQKAQRRARRITRKHRK